jgi:CelD/BcsL family acetyltransferase involved in cellulose biosynthesis
MTNHNVLSRITMHNFTVPRCDGMEFQIYTDLPSLRAIESDWNDLWCRSSGQFITHSYDFTAALCRNPLRREREKLWCLIGRRDGALVLVWPFIIYWHGAWRVASPIADTIDSNDPLMDEQFDRNELMRSGISHALRHCPTDLIQFTMIRFESNLKQLVEKVHLAVSTYITDIPAIKFQDFNDFTLYERKMSKTQRSGFARKRRRLMELGHVEFTVLPPTDIEKVVAWMLPRKNSWLAQKKKIDETHMSSPNMTSFLIDIFRMLGHSGRCKIFAVLHKGEFVAIDLIFVGRQDVQWYFGTYNPNYEKYSPGILLKENVVRWAFDHNLHYDMQRGYGNHKTYFANYVDHATTFRIPGSAWGCCYVALRHILKSMRVIH